MQEIALKLYLTVKSRTVIDFLHSMGIVLPYNRVREIVLQLVQRAMEYFREKGALVPFNMLMGILLLCVVDNVDKNARSTTGGHFHGTSLSVYQQPRPGTQFKTNNKCASFR